MFYPVSLTSLFASVGLSHGLWLPLVAILLLCALTLPSALRSDIRPEVLVRAAYCYLLQTFGIVLMTAGAIPAVYAVFAMQPLTPLTYLGLLAVFGVGGALFLWHDDRLSHMDHASKVLPHAIFLHAWKLVGLLIFLASLLSLVLNIMLVEQTGGDWWISHMIMILYGLLISWFTLDRTPQGRPFTSVDTSVTPIATRARIAKSTRKPVKTVKRPKRRSKS